MFEELMVFDEQHCLQVPNFTSSAARIPMTLVNTCFRMTYAVEMPQLVPPKSDRAAGQVTAIPLRWRGDTRVAEGVMKPNVPPAVVSVGGPHHTGDPYRDATLRKSPLTIRDRDRASC